MARRKCQLYLGSNEKGEGQRKIGRQTSAYMCSVLGGPTRNLCEREQAVQQRPLTGGTGIVTSWASTYCVSFSKWIFSNFGDKDNQQLTIYPSVNVYVSLSES